MNDNGASRDAIAAEEIFAEAIDLPVGQRTKFVNERCLNDDVLKANVRLLIDEAAQVGGFLNPDEIRQITAAGSGLERGADEHMLPAGTQLGTYTIRGVLGVGGMGVVYRAEQDRPHRTVALKVIRRGLNAPGILKRFEHEAEVLGRLLHPGIAQIYEAGTAKHQGRDLPYIAMELVEGKNLTQYVATHQPETSARLSIFAALCDAVHHAHQRGIIHRDLKPGNILITERGEPKVLDFGVARAVHNDLLVTTLRTNIGQLIGTLAYMSPEQVVGDPADIDVRSDVYSLGVILYELLTGRLPHDLGSRTIPEAARIIREDRPTKLSHISRVFRGDLDTIVSKSIEKELPRRYQSAKELADDIRLHLAGQPIVARQDSTWYLLRKQLNRHRWPVIGAIVFVIGLIAFSIHASFTARAEKILASESAAARAEAIAERDKVREANNLLAEELQRSVLAHGRREAASGNLPLAEDLLWQCYFKNPDSPGPRWALRELYRETPILWTVQGISEPAAACFGVDGKRLAMVDSSGTLAWYDTQTGSELSRRESIGVNATCLAMMPDGSACVVGFAHGGMAVVPWDASQAVVTIGHDLAHSIGTTAICVNPQGTVLASAGSDKAVRLWDVNTQSIIRSWNAHSEITNAIAFNHDGTLLATGPRLQGKGEIARIWNVQTGDLSREFKLPATSNTALLLFAKDNSCLYVGNLDRHLYRFDLYDDSAPQTIHQFATYCAAASESSNGIAFVDSDGVHVMSQSADSHRLLVGPPKVRSLAAAWTSANTIAVVSADGSFRCVDAGENVSQRKITGFSTWCFGVDFSPDSASLAIAPGTGARNDLPVIVSLHNPDHRVQAKITQQGVRTRCVRFLPDSNSVVIGSADGKMRIIDATTGDVREQWGDQSAEIYSLDINRDASLVVVGYANGVVQAWNLTSQQLAYSLPKSESRISGVAFSQDGLLLAVASGDAAIGLWDQKNGQFIASLQTSSNSWAIAFSPDCERLLACNSDGSVDVFSLKTRTKLQTLQAHGGFVPGISYSPDGQIFATGGADNTVKVWDAKTLNELASFHPDGGIVEVRFDSTGRFLAGSSANGVVYVYDLLAGEQCIAGNMQFQRKRKS